MDYKTQVMTKNAVVSSGSRFDHLEKSGFLKILFSKTVNA